MHIIAITSVLSRGFQLVFQLFLFQSVAIQTHLEPHGPYSVNVRIAGLVTHYCGVVKIVSSTHLIRHTQQVARAGSSAWAHNL